jgi:MSHA biogenesis protein MshL
MKWNVLALIAPMVLAGCSSTYPKADLSTQEKILGEMDRVAARSASRAIPEAVPANVLDALVQSPMRTEMGATAPSTRGASGARFDLIVTEAPIGQVLAGLVEGTSYSIMLKPAEAKAGAAGAADASKRVSFNLKNITLFEALDALRDVYGYDYTIENQRILVQPAELQTRLYYVNYILGQRRGVSDIQVIGGASVGQSSSSTVGSSSTSSSSYGSVQASGLSTSVKSDIWTEVEDALRTMLGCSIPKVAAQKSGGGGLGANASKANASRADVSSADEPQSDERLRGADGCSQGRALAINAMSGTILVRGMPTELRMVDRVLKTMQLNISRQVIIESKIIDVELNKDSQQGVNWSMFKNGLHRMSAGANAAALGVNQPAATAGQNGGAVASTATLAGLLGTSVSPPGALSSTAGIAFQATNFAALINFLESQGRVHVLSSPRISTLNNQKAVIKVGSEEPFVTNIVGGTTTVGATSTTVNPSLTYQPFFSGIALDVTPQIDANDNITLHVHTMVNRVEEKEKVALPGSTTMVPFAVNSMNETDSVVKARDGQVVVIGGLMTERNADSRGGVPGVRDVPGAGALFNWGLQQSTKRELVILLKSTVLKDDADWNEQISETAARLNELKVAPR